MKQKLIIAILFIIPFSANAALLTKLADGSYLINHSPFMGLELIKDFSRINSLNLVLGNRVKDFKVRVIGPKTISAKNIEEYLSTVFHQASYSLLPTHDEIQVITARTVRYHSLPLLTDKKKIPHNNNYIRFLIPGKHIKMNALVRTIRPFLSRYGRIISTKGAESIVIQDTGKNVLKIIELVAKIDTAETASAQLAVRNLNNKLRDLGGKKGSIWKNLLKEHILFIILFSLISLMIGFSFRGYVIRRIEGGL